MTTVLTRSGMTQVRAMVSCGLAGCILAGSVLASTAQSVEPWSRDWLGTVQSGDARWDRDRAGPQQVLRIDRQDAALSGEIPQVYRGAESPFEPTLEVLLAGQAIYARDCAACHGQRGLGDGDAGYALDPSPALLSLLSGTPNAADEYLLWTVSDGGEPFGSEMPAFRDRLDRDEMWQVIAYMRAGLPQEID